MIKTLFKCASIETLATGALRRVFKTVLPVIVMGSSALLTGCASGTAPSLLGQMPEILGGDKPPIKLSATEITGIQSTMQKIAGNDMMLVDKDHWTELLCAMKDAKALLLMNKIKRGEEEPRTIAVTCDIKPTVPDFLSDRIARDVQTEEALRETFASYLNALPKTILGDEGVMQVKINDVTTNASLGISQASLSQIGEFPFMTAINAENGALPVIVAKGAGQEAVPNYVKTLMDDILGLPGLQNALGIDPVDLYKIILYHEASHANPNTAQETAFHNDYKEAEPQETKPALTTFIIVDPICDPAQIEKEKTENREKIVKALIDEEASDTDALKALRKEKVPEKFKTLLDGWMEFRLASTVFNQDGTHQTLRLLAEHFPQNEASFGWIAKLSPEETAKAYEEIGETLTRNGFPPGHSDEVENFLKLYADKTGFENPNAQRFAKQALEIMRKNRTLLGLPLPPPLRSFDPAAKPPVCGKT